MKHERAGLLLRLLVLVCLWLFLLVLCLLIFFSLGVGGATRPYSTPALDAPYTCFDFVGVLAVRGLDSL